MAIESDVAHLHPDIVNDPNIGLTLQGAEKNASSRQRQVVSRSAKNRRHLPSTRAAHDGRQPSARDLFPGVSAGSYHVGAKETCTPQVSCPPGWAAPAESKTPEPASAAEIFRISRRLRPPTEWIAILGPLPRRTWKATQRHTGCTRKRNSDHDSQIAVIVQRAALAPVLIAAFSAQRVWQLGSHFGLPASAH